MINDQPLFQSKSRAAAQIGATFIAILFIAGGIFLMHQAFTSPFIDSTKTWVFVFNLAFPVIVFYSIYNSENYKIYNDRIEIYTITGRLKETILQQDINSWDEVQFKGKNGIVNSLYIFWGDNRYLIADKNSFDDYDGLKKHITKSKKRNNNDWQADIRAKRKPWPKAVLAMGLILFGAGAISMQYKEPAVTQQQLTTISGPLYNAFNKNLGKAGHRFVCTLSNYPDFTFVLKNGTTSQQKVRVLLNVAQRGDTIRLDIPTEAYNKKIARNTPLTWLDRNYIYNYIDAYNLSMNGNQYAYVEWFNQLYAGKSGDSYIVFFVMGAVLVFWV